MGEIDHDATMAAGALPTEGGQAAFASIQEIVAKLEADPGADWSRVDIEALRQHLIDMDNVTLRAAINVDEAGGSVRFTVLGQGPVRDSIRRMNMAHAATMNNAEGWTFTAAPTDTGAVLTVTPPDRTMTAKLRALGFIGVMARGMHHNQHQWMLAAGIAPHE